MSSYVNLRLSIRGFRAIVRKILRLVVNAASASIVSFLSTPSIYTDVARMDTALRMREILSTRGLTLYDASRRSAEIFGRSSQFYVPHNLYYNLAHTLSIPTIFQILALSHITDYRLSDWLAVLGFDLDAISRLQLQIPRQQTTILDSTVYDTHAWIPWLAERPGTASASSIAPLGYFLARAAPKRVKDLLALNKRTFLYAMVGERDLYALPYFIPGSIVRVDTRHMEEQPLGRNTHGEGPFFFVEHEFGFTCSRLIRLGKDRILLHCPQRPCADRELHIGRDGRILGVIDAEIRPVATHHYSTRVTAKSTASIKARLEPPLAKQTGLKGLLRHSRISVGLSFRDASSISRLIADELSDELYFAAASTLSDYEVLSAPPRHIQKIITLCLLYCIGFEQFLRSSGLPLERAGQEPMPDALIRRQVPGRNHGSHLPEKSGVLEPGGFVAALVNQWEEIPLFLRFSLDEITRLKGFSLSDVFWVGAEKAPQHPLLANATFVVVGRRARKPPPQKGSGVCGQPLYLILRRDGSYLCGRCTLDEGNLVVHGYPRGSVGPQQFRNGVDAQVIGQVTTILRRLL
jgi:hypothetical protein